MSAADVTALDLTRERYALPQPLTRQERIEADLRTIVALLAHPGPADKQVSA